jgi:hypothetical protein
MSRSRFPVILAAQYAAFVRGGEEWAGQPCQKQPSMKTATRGPRNTMSAATRMSATGLTATR